MTFVLVTLTPPAHKAVHDTYEVLPQCVSLDPPGSQSNEAARSARDVLGMPPLKAWLRGLGSKEKLQSVIQA